MAINEFLPTFLLFAGLITFIVCTFWTIYNLNKEDKKTKKI